VPSDPAARVHRVRAALARHSQRVAACERFREALQRVMRQGAPTPADIGAAHATWGAIGVVPVTTGSHATLALHGLDSHTLVFSVHPSRDEMVHGDRVIRTWTADDREARDVECCARVFVVALHATLTIDST